MCFIVQLNSAVSSKESTPGQGDLDSIGVVKVHSGDDGEEVQEVEVSVRDVDPGEDTGVDQGDDSPVVELHNKPSPRTSTGRVARLPLKSLGMFLRN